MTDTDPRPDPTKDWPTWARGAHRFLQIGGPSGGESRAHQVSNRLIRLWTVGLVAVILLPIIVSNGNGVGAIVGLTAAGVLFVPWLIGLVILMVLRSTTRSR